MKKKVVIGILGSTLDARGGWSDKRWEKWRPTVSLCSNPDFGIDRIELLYSDEVHRPLADLVQGDVAHVSESTEVVQHYVPLTDPWDFPQVFAALHDFALSYTFEEDCDYYVHLTTGTHVAQICLFLLTEARYFPAKLLESQMDKAASVAWHGKLDIIDLDLSKYDALASRFSTEKLDSEVLLKSGIDTKDPAFNKMIARMENVAVKSKAPILLRGDTGVGKTKLAKRLFNLRARRHLVTGPFVDVNCATLNAETAMSALFGHTKGAFTGATTARKGYLLEADNGMLFLDEIGTLPLTVQAFLLRALEDKEFYPMGSDKPVKSNFQLIAGTNLDLAQEVALGNFREDLYARINTWSFRIPSLVERRADIEPNIEYELHRTSDELGRLISFNSEARALYLDFAMKAPWPGNFRDLSASIMRMGTLADGGRITTDDVDCELECLVETWGSTKAEDAIQESLAAKVLPGQEIDEFDLAQLEAVLHAIKNSSSMAEAGRLLFAVSRRSKSSNNDTHRVSKYLSSWKLSYADVKAAVSA